MILNEKTLEKKIDYFIQENNLKKNIKQRPHRNISKTNPKSTSKIQCTSEQTVTQILSKYKTYSPKTEHIHKNAQR